MSIGPEAVPTRPEVADQKATPVPRNSLGVTKFNAVAAQALSEAIIVKNTPMPTRKIHGLALVVAKSPTGVAARRRQHSSETAHRESAAEHGVDDTPADELAQEPAAESVVPSASPI